jgi:hypothetical protein
LRSLKRNHHLLFFLFSSSPSLLTMPADRIQIIDLVLPYLIPTDSSPLSRPSQRYSILLKLSLLSHSIHDRIQKSLYAEVHIAAGNSQLVSLLASLKGTPNLAKLIRRLSFVSRHREAKRWNQETVESIVGLCTELRDLVVAIPTLFGLNENFLCSKALASKLTSFVRSQEALSLTS